MSSILLLVCLLSLTYFLFTRSEFHRDQFKKKYIGKEFTKEDITNDVLNMTDIEKHINQSLDLCYRQTVDLIRQGVAIVNDHESFTLAFHNNLGDFRCRTIYITTPKQRYEVTYEHCWGQNVIRLTLFNTKKQYMFHDLSQVELYFDLFYHIHF